MLKKILFSIPLLSTLSYSQTLHNITSEIIATNPEIKEKIYYYNSVKEEYNFVKSGNLPIVDFSIKFGREHTNSPSTRKETDEDDEGIKGLGLYKSESSLEVVQNLFEGFATANAIDEQKARYLSASLEILEKTNSIALNVAQIYINVLKYKEMVILAKESIETHKKILVQIKEKVDAGFSPRSDMLQVQTRYTLAKSNLLTQKNNLENELIKFHKILGRFIAKKEFVLPSSHFDVPDDIDRATELALNTHPAIKVSNFNVQARKFAYEKEKRGYYPSVDLILKAEKNNNTSAIEGETDRYYAGVQLKYNLFNGFADEATIQQNISNIQEENSLRDKIRRQIIESVRLSWSRYSSLVKKEIVLKEHVLFADQAKEAYLEEFLIAKRTLLDILNIEGEFNSAKKAQTDNYYTMLYTKYQLMDSLGILSQQLGLTSSEYEYEKDSLPLNLESDNDRIIDMKDICDKTINTMGVNRYGCQEIMEEEEDEQIEEPALLEPVKKIKRKPVVKPKPKINSIAKVKPVKKQDEKVKRSLEKEMIYFEYKSSLITEKSIHILDRVLEIMKKDRTVKLELFAYTDSLASKKYNKKLSLSRALIVKNHLLEEGIASSRIFIYGKGEDSPIASNDTKEGRAKNRRVELLFIESKQSKKVDSFKTVDIELEPLNFDLEEDIESEVVEFEEVEEVDVEFEQIEIDF